MITQTDSTLFSQLIKIFFGSIKFNIQTWPPLCKESQFWKQTQQAFRTPNDLTLCCFRKYPCLSHGRLLVLIPPQPPGKYSIFLSKVCLFRLPSLLEVAMNVHTGTMDIFWNSTIYLSFTTSFAVYRKYPFICVNSCFIKVNIHSLTPK